VKVQNEGTRQYIGYCLDPYDLAASKLAAGRDKDLAFVGELLPLDTERRQRIEMQVVALGEASGQVG
jgi:hypothetical protein